MTPEPVADQREDVDDDGAPDTTLTDAGHSHAQGIWCDECPDAEEKRAAVAAEAAQRGAKRCTCWTHVITRDCPVHDPDGRAAPTASEDTQHWCPQCPEKPTPEPVTADRAAPDPDGPAWRGDYYTWEPEEGPFHFAQRAATDTAAPDHDPTTSPEDQT